MRHTSGIIANFRSLVSSDRRLFSVIGGIAVVGIGLGVSWTYWISNRLLVDAAQHTAIQWAETVKGAVGASSVFETGALPQEAATILAAASREGVVFQYRIYNSAGEIVVASRRDDLGRHMAESDTFAAVAQGTTYAATRLDQPTGPVRHYAAAYIPEIRGGAFRGAVAVYVDIADHVARNRQNFWLATSGLVALLLASALVAGFVVFRNILARQKAEARFHDAIETISEGFAMYDPSDRFVLCNSRYREFYAHIADLLVPGARFEDILRTGAARGQYPEAEGREEEWIAERMQQHRMLGEPIERHLPDGRWVKIAETRSRDGSTVGIRADITALKTREMQLRKSEERLRMIVDSLQEGFVLFDSEDRIVMWNEKWFELHSGLHDIIDVGVTFTELVTTGVARKLYPESYGREEEYIAQRIARHQNPGNPILRKLHDQRWYIIKEIRTDEGGTFAINFDVTELKKAQSAAEDARREAERANRAKSEFLAGMSHELRTPLNAVLGFSEILADEAFGRIGNPKYRDYAQFINDSGQHLLALINDLLDLAKVEAGKHEMEEEAVRLVEVIRDCIRLIDEQARDGDVTVDLQVPGDVPALWGDKRKLKQIVLNLLANAVKFTPAGGSVTIAVAQGADGGLCMELADTGIGIAASDISKALSPFGQIDNRLTSKVAGTGLGLPLTKSFVELHGGTFELESEPGKGTKATVRFPPERTIGKSGIARAGRA